MRRGKILAGVVAIIVAIAPIAAASAHAFPRRSVPAVGSHVVNSPTEVRIWFTEKLEPAFSRIEVLDAAGVRVDQDDANVDARDATLLHVSVKPLAAGTYKVVWHVVSVDTHPTEGSFSFTVGA